MCPPAAREKHPEGEREAWTGAAAAAVQAGVGAPTCAARRAQCGTWVPRAGSGCRRGSRAAGERAEGRHAFGKRSSSREVTGAIVEIGHSLAALQPLPLVPRVLHLQMTGVGRGVRMLASVLQKTFKEEKSGSALGHVRSLVFFP